MLTGPKMGTITIKIPLVTWRDGRPRWFPSASFRKLGYKGEDLRHDNGQWFTVEECKAWSDAKQVEIAERRRAERQRAAGEALAARPTTRRLRAARPKHRAALTTLCEIVTDFVENDPRNQGREMVEGRKKRKPRAEHTVRFYRTCMAALEDVEAGHTWHRPLSACGPDAMGELLDRVEIARGLSMARGVRTLVAQSFDRAIAARRASVNPMRSLTDRLPVPDERVRVGTVPEMLALTDVFDRIGRPEMADCVWLALFSAQRQGDRLSLEQRQIGPDGVLWLQSKTGERLIIPLARIVAARLQAARKRREGWTVTPTRVVVDERAGKPLRPDWYRKLFRLGRDIAATGRPGEADRKLLGATDLAAALQGFEPVASLADFRDQDLRDTALSWADYAGCDDAEIGNLSGHRFARETRILRHYVTKFDPAKARNAVTKTETWFDAQVKHLKEVAR